MSRLVIMCIETNKKARTDEVYIKSVINRFFVNDRKNICKYVYLETKTKYKDRGKVQEINSWKKKFLGETRVIYCIDVDDYEISNDTKKLFDTIENYCNENEYDLVFFDRDVEDVFWGEKVSDKEKVKKAGAFVKKQND